MGIFNFFKKSGAQELFESDQWKRKCLEIEKYQRFQDELSPISDKYYAGLEKIQSDWSILYNLKEYSGQRSIKYESDCKRNIQLYKQMIAIEKRNGEKPPQNAPAYKRLAMLYEKRGMFEDAVSVCIDALRNGADGDGMQGRLVRMIKKAGRTPTDKELKLL